MRLVHVGSGIAQIATGPGDKGPIDITADKLDKYDDEHKVVYTPATSRPFRTVRAW
ncbi:MAG: hypothetical protein WDN45_06685 [Caulobacteraceae bacterium]